MSYDPTIEKSRLHTLAMNPVVSAQPVATYSVSNGALPIQENFHNPPMYAIRPATGRWGDNICDWPKNLFPSCWCTCCCCYGMWITAQMSQKTGFTTFQCPITTYVVIWVISLIITLATGISDFIILIPMFFALFFAIALRLHIVRKQNITEFGGCFGEFCCGLFCWYCSVAQMARHLYGYTKVLDGDGDPDRPDNYGPVEQV